MKKKICTACGKKINSQSAYCPSCGTEVVREEVEEVKEHKKGKGGIKFLLISLAIQIVLIILFVAFLVTESESILGGVVMFLMIASPLLVLIASIIAIVKSKQSPQKKGRKLGTTFAVIDGLLVVLICVVFVMPADTTSDVGTMDYFEAEDDYNTTFDIKLVPVVPKDPAIGMTAEQVRKSTWGRPDEINRTTTEYGIHEQWVYSNYRYIYLDDGIVTAIQD